MVGRRHGQHGGVDDCVVTVGVSSGERPRLFDAGKARKYLGSRGGRPGGADVVGAGSCQTRQRLTQLRERVGLLHRLGVVRLGTAPVAFSHRVLELLENDLVVAVNVHDIEERLHAAGL